MRTIALTFDPLSKNKSRRVVQGQRVGAVGGWLAALGPGADAADQAALGAEVHVRKAPGGIVAASLTSCEPARIEALGDAVYSAKSGENGGSDPSSATLDLNSNTLTASADPFGLSGCYWRRENETVWCASSPLLLPLPGRQPRRMDPAALHGYLCFSYVPQPRAILGGVSSLISGTTAVWDPYKMDLGEATPWVESPITEAGPDHHSHQLRTLLKSSVQRCLGGATEAAVYLSGGLDSSLVAALLREAGARVHLFTLDFGAPWNQELAIAEQVARHLERPLHVVPAGPEEIRRHLEGTAAALHQPFGDAVTVPLYLLGKAASEVCPLVFNGEGGDQLFGGWANKPMIAAELYGGADFNRLDAYMATYHRFWGLTDSLYTPGARRAVAGVDARDWVRPALSAPVCPSLLHKLRAANLVLKGAQNIAPRAVQLGGCHGLRVRAPFFDRELAEWTFSLSPEVFLQGACEKYVLKQVAEQYLPSDVVWREKRGMGVPSAEWCLGALRREVRYYLGRQRLRRDGWFDSDAIAALVSGVDQPGEFRSRRVGEKLWLLLMLHAWLEVHSVVFSS